MEDYSKELLREEIQTLSKRVEALIEWVEKYEQSLGHSGYLELEKAGKVDETGVDVARQLPLLIKDEKSQDPFHDFRSTSNSKEQEDKQWTKIEEDENKDVDLFGASSSFGQTNDAPPPNPTSVSLLQWD